MGIARLIRAVPAALLVAPMMAVPPVMAGTDSGEIVFRVTLEGPVDPADAFKLVVECSGHHYCGEIGNFVCAPPLSDTVVCEAKSYEVLLAMAPQSIEYALYRAPDLTAFSQEEHLLVAGSWDVHPDRQVISLGYAYPDAESTAPALPDTAMPAG